MEDDTVKTYHGEKRCQREGCTNGAYWAMPDGQLLCGVHSKRDADARRPLPKDKDAKRKRAESYAEFRARTIAPRWQKAGEKLPLGHVACHRLGGRGKQVPLEEGWLSIFPNNWHGSRPDGEGMPELSPMRLGPVTHGEPGLPDATCIENYFQFSKCYLSEVDPRTQMPTLAFYARQIEGFRDPEPHRHKFGGEQMAREVALLRASRLARGDAEESDNAAAFAVHRSQTGAERHFTYVQSRWFYCVAYEKLAQQRPEFAQLRSWRASGVSLRICGYDAYDMGTDASADALYAHYCDPTKPFGHERVLCALLLLADTPAALPWRRYEREHAHMYRNMCSM